MKGEGRGMSVAGMKYGLDVAIHGEFADPALLAELAAQAEAAGWDGFFVQDGLLHSEVATDPWIALAAIAARTSRIRIGALVTALARRHPWQVARQSVALDQLSGGRLIFGAGLGFETRDFSAFGQEADARIRAERLDEGLAILDGLWSGEPVTFQGAHYQVKQARFRPRPVQSPRIPVWIAGFWPNRRPFRRAARWDGLYVGTQKADGELLTPGELREAIAYVNAHRKGAGPFDVAFAGTTPPDPQEGRALVQPFADAGVTWWLEGIWESPASASERIGHGPPKS
jgi:alkanesulfonate monooxygenase SsuD/methylene tetrahydromethanopterin reductase-like flavin-dependent oxidoreductase (luciferase family)